MFTTLVPGVAVAQRESPADAAGAQSVESVVSEEEEQQEEDGGKKKKRKKKKSKDTEAAPAEATSGDGGEGGKKKRKKKKSKTEDTAPAAATDDEGDGKKKKKKRKKKGGADTDTGADTANNVESGAEGEGEGEGGSDGKKKKKKKKKGGKDKAAASTTGTVESESEPKKKKKKKKKKGKTGDNNTSNSDSDSNEKSNEVSDDGGYASEEGYALPSTSANAKARKGSSGGKKKKKKKAKRSTMSGRSGGSESANPFDSSSSGRGGDDYSSSGEGGPGLSDSGNWRAASRLSAWEDDWKLAHTNQATEIAEQVAAAQEGVRRCKAELKERRAELSRLLAIQTALTSRHSRLYEEFWSACEAGEVAVVRKLAGSVEVDALRRRTVNRDEHETESITGLGLAARNGHAAVIGLLLRRDADPDARCTVVGYFYSSEWSTAQTALHIAAAAGNEECINALLKGGADLGARLRRHIDGERADDHGSTALHVACSEGNIDAANTLIAAGASLQARNNSGQRPFQVLPPTAVVFRDTDAKFSVGAAGDDFIGRGGVAVVVGSDEYSEEDGLVTFAREAKASRRMRRMSSSSSF